MELRAGRGHLCEVTVLCQLLSWAPAVSKGAEGLGCQLACWRRGIRAAQEHISYFQTRSLSAVRTAEGVAVVTGLGGMAVLV